MAEGDLDRSLRFPRVRLDSVEGLEEGARGGEYWVPASTSCRDDEREDFVDWENDRLCDCWTASRDCGEYLGNAAGDGGLIYDRGDLARGQRYGPLLGCEKARRGEGEAACRVGDGLEVIISISSWRLLPPRLPSRLRWEELLDLVCERKARAYLYRRERRVCSS